MGTAHSDVGQGVKCTTPHQLLHEIATLDDWPRTPQPQVCRVRARDTEGQRQLRIDAFSRWVKGTTRELLADLGWLIAVHGYSADGGVD